VPFGCRERNLFNPFCGIPALFWSGSEDLMRYLLNGLFSLSLICAAQPVLAQTPSGPLAPGKAAGVQAAQTDLKINKLEIAGGLALGALAAYLIVGTHYHGYTKPKTSAASGTH
jgi:hypothetical protein